MESKGDFYLTDVEFVKCSSEERVSIHGSKWLRWIPTRQVFSVLISCVLIILFILCVLYGVLDKEVLPGSELFSLFLLYICAFVGGKFMMCIYLPPLLGMLIAGFMFRNFIPEYYKHITVRWTSTLRGSALVIILLKAGLGLDSEKLRQLKSVVLQLAFIPCLIETITIAIASHFLIQLPWTWAILLGFVISAVSPAVVVPSLLSLQEKKYGTHKGVPTLVVASASVDDILAITGFTIMLSISLSEGSWIWSLAKGILEPLAGFIFGVACGWIVWYIPAKDISEVVFCEFSNL